MLAVQTGCSGASQVAKIQKTDLQTIHITTAGQMWAISKQQEAGLDFNRFQNHVGNFRKEKG